MLNDGNSRIKRAARRNRTPGTRMGMQCRNNLNIDTFNKVMLEDLVNHLLDRKQCIAHLLQPVDRPVVSSSTTADYVGHKHVHFQDFTARIVVGRINREGVPIAAAM